MLVYFLEGEVEVTLLTQLELLTALAADYRTHDWLCSASCALTSMVNHESLSFMLMTHNLKITKNQLTESLVKTFLTNAGPGVTIEKSGSDDPVRAACQAGMLVDHLYIGLISVYFIEGGPYYLSLFYQ